MRLINVFHKQVIEILIACFINELCWRNFRAARSHMQLLQPAIDQICIIVFLAVSNNLYIPANKNGRCSSFYKFCPQNKQFKDILSLHLF